jgi:hypothetical protein
VRLFVEKVYFESLSEIIEITEGHRRAGCIEVIQRNDRFESPDVLDFDRTIHASIKEVENYNERARKQNEEIERGNEERKRQPRECTFVVFPFDLSPPTAIIDEWLTVANGATPLAISIKLLDGVGVETRGEAIGARIHGSLLAMQPDGTLLWNDRVVVKIDDPKFTIHPTISLKPHDGVSLKFSEFQLEELMATLCELLILTPPQKNGSRRKR